MLELGVHRGRHAENLDAGRRSVGSRGVRQAALERVVETVDLIAEDPGLGAENVAIVQVRIVEDPVSRSIDREATLAARRESSLGGVDAAEAIDADSRRAGPVHFGVFP